MVVGKGLRIGEMGFRLAEVIVVIKVAEDRRRLWYEWRCRKKKVKRKELGPEKKNGENGMDRFERVNWMDRVWVETKGVQSANRIFPRRGLTSFQCVHFWDCPELGNMILGPF